MLTRIGDRIFISVVLFIGIHLLWMRFLEQYLPLLIATIMGWTPLVGQYFVIFKIQFTTLLFLSKYTSAGVL